MWSATNQWTDDTDYGKAKSKIAELKHEYLPQVIQLQQISLMLLGTLTWKLIEMKLILTLS